VIARIAASLAFKAVEKLFSRRVEMIFASLAKRGNRGNET